MDKARETRRPWRSWTAIALVLAALALAQACGQSGSRTGPSTTSPAALQLKLRRAGGAELPPGCGGGTYSVTGPGYTTQGTFGSDGKITLQLNVGYEYTISITANCPPPVGSVSGSTTFLVPPGGTTATVVINVSKVVGLSCNPSTVDPGQTSTCTCDVQSVNGANITWTGVNATGPTANFSNQTPNTYTISCTINGIDTRSTTVTVKAPEPPPPVAPPPPTTGTIRIFIDTLQLLQRRGLAFFQGPSIFARVQAFPSTTTRQIEVGTSQTVSAPPGAQTVEGACNSGFTQTLRTKPAQVVAGQEVAVHFDFAEDFGFCD